MTQIHQHLLAQPIFGFTGTRQGMTIQQQGVVRFLLAMGSGAGFDGEGPEFNHGCCIGADLQAHKIAKSMGYSIRAHPPTEMDHAVIPEDADVVESPYPYLQRDQNIVLRSSVMIATPKNFVEEIRSGTWATVRRARKFKRPVWIIQPDGNSYLDFDYKERL